jgi:hypothetical protein
MRLVHQLAAMSGKRTDVRRPPARNRGNLEVLRYKTGHRIPQSGIYRVLHSEHRLPHDVTLLTGEDFPRCAQCGNDVQFELVRAAPDIKNRDFHVVVYELPERSA